LRQKKSINNNSTSEELSLDSHLNEKGHVNLFYKEEQQLNGKNEERENEEKAEKEKFESQFIYSLTGKDKEKPWYSLDKSTKVENTQFKVNGGDKLKKLKKDKKRKEIEDPLELIKKNLAKNKEIELKIKESLPYYQREINKSNEITSNTETFTNPTKLLKEFNKKRDMKDDDSESSSSESSSDSSDESDSSSSRSSHKKRRHSKHRHHSHHHHKRSHSHKHDKYSKKHSKKKRRRHNEELQQNGKTTIEKLREERLKREQEERQRALTVNGVQASPALQVNKVEEDKYYYNSQFNPDSIRQLKRKQM